MRRVLILIMVIAPGCVQPQNAPEHFGNGYVLMLPGVENSAWTMAGIARGLRDGGINQAIEINQWGVWPFGTFPNLRHYRENRQKAAMLANMLVQYRREHAEAPITLVGYSGGGGMALFVAEALPCDVMLDRIILLAPAISPDYDLTAALARSRRGIVNFYSPRDSFMLGWATQTFGSMDRVYGNCAGQVSFLNEGGTIVQNDQITQIAWQSSWLRLWNDGSHDGWLSYAWAREILTPRIDSTVSQRVSR